MTRAADAGRRRVLATSVILALCLLVLDLAAPLAGSPFGLRATPARAAIPPVPGPCVAGWRQMPVPDRAFDATPFEILARDGRPAWILGGSNQGLLALRWRGGAWRATGTRTNGHTGLVGGATMRGRQVIAVGYRRPMVDDEAGRITPISGRILGARRWVGRTVRKPPGGRATLADVESLANGRAWAVGTRLQRGRSRAYALRWSGRRWVRDEPALGTGSGLTTVERAPGGATWAAGWRESALGRPLPYIVRRRVGRWAATPLPTLTEGQAVITDLRFRSRDRGWAVGYVVARGSDRHGVFLLRWDGRAWSRAPLPWAEDFAAVPRALAVGDDGQLWIAGTQTATAQRESRGFIAHGQGGAWTVTQLDARDDVRSEVMAVAATERGAVAAATVGGSLLVLHACDAGPGIARTGRRVRLRVSDMPARRRVPVEEDLGGEGDRAAATEIATALAARSPRAPVRARGFRIRDVAKAAGLGQRTITYRGLAADFDGDGLRDVFIGRHGGRRPRLALNGPDGFTNAPTVAFSALDRHGCDSGDVDQDGERDILCAIGAARGKSVKRHELSLAPARGVAALEREANGISDPLGRGRHVALIRLDGDPYPEAFITNAPDREDGLPGYNRFYRNVDGRFVPAPSVRLDTSHGGVCTATGDFDGDGDEDLAYCTDAPVSGRPPGLRLMLNITGSLIDRTRLLGLSPIGDADVAWADVTGDGRRDIIQLSHALLRVSRRTGSGFERHVQVRLRGAVAVAAGDVNGDGAADIYVARGTNRRNLPDLLLISRDRGRRLVSTRIPQTRLGSADDVLALDYDGNGRTDFVVLNGRRNDPGPIQLLAAFPG